MFRAAIYLLVFLAIVAGNFSQAEAISTSALTDPRELTLALQKELNRVGCDAGSADGKWGAKGRNALSRFNTHAKSALPTDQPTAKAFEAVKDKTARVCPKPPIKPKKKQVVKKPIQKKKVDKKPSENPNRYIEKRKGCDVVHQDDFCG